MEERTRYTRGTKVEVLNMNDPPFGSWRCGEIVSGDGHTYMVQYYSSNSATTRDTLERVSYKFIRPYPPLLDISRAWAPGELVEVFENFSWRMGSVMSALGRNYFLIRLLGFSQVLRASSSYIRARRSWQDDRWTLIGLGSSTLDRPNSIRHREIIDVGSYDASARPSPRSNDNDGRSLPSSTSSCSISIHDSCHEPPSSDILSTHSSDAESSCYENCQQGNEKADVEVHRLELHAYNCTMEALGASGSLTWEQESLVTNLRMLLHISNDEHLSKLRQLVQVDRQMRVS